MASKTTSVSSTGAVLDSSTYTKQTWAETTAAGANTYAIQDDATTAKLSLRGSTDKIYIEGFSSEYQVKASGKTVTLKSDTQTITIVLNSVSKTTVVADTLVFLDGSLALGNSSGSTAIKLGTQSLSTKYADLTAETTASDLASDYFNGVVEGDSFSLASGATVVEGTAGDDDIAATLAADNIWDTGDVIDGGDGEDTLTLTVNSSTASGALVEISNVENIDVRLLAETGELNAVLWDGAATVAITDNTIDGASSMLSVINAATTNTFRIEDANATLMVEIDGMSSGADSVSLELAGAGSGSASVVGNAATANLDQNASGLLDTVNISVSGDNFVTIEAGASATTYNLTGNGTVNLTTNDTLTSLNAAALTGTNFFTLTGTSNVSAVGGHGNDTFTLGTTLGNGDTINGGSGNDVLVATVNASVNPKGMTNVEEADLTFAVSGGTFDASGVAGLDNIELQTLAQSATVRSLSGVATVDVTEDFNALEISTVSGDSVTINFGSASGGSGAAVSGSGGVSLTGMSAVTIQGVGSGTNAISGAVVIEDATDVTIQAVGSATLNIGGGGDELAAADASALTLKTLGSATLAIGTAMEDASNLTSVTIDAQGGNISLADGFGTGGAVTSNFSINYVANSADIAQVDAYNFTTGSGSDEYTVDVSIKAADNSHIAVGTADDFLRFGALATGNSADIRIGTFELIGSGSGSIDIGDISGAALGIGDINVTVAGASGSATVGVILASSIEDITLNGGNGGITFGTITTDKTFNDLYISGSATLGNIAASGTIGNIEINANSASVTLGTINVGGASGGVGNIDITSNNGTVTLGNITANNLGEVNVEGTGTTVIDLSGVSGNGVTINLGSGTNTLTLSDGADTVNLVTGTGVDTLVVNGSASGEAADFINAFQALSGDVIRFASSLEVNYGSGASAQAASAAAVQLLGSASAALDTLSADKNIFIFTSSDFDDASAMLAALQLFSVSGNSGQIQQSGNLVVGWTDAAGDSHISLVTLAASGDTLASAATAATDILVLQDTTFVSATITAAMFDIQ